MDEILDVLNQYYNKFQRDFPTIGYMDTPDEEIIGIVNACIKSNVPYEDLFNKDLSDSDIII